VSKTNYEREQFKVGCYVDESAGSADDLTMRIVQFAQDYGFKPGRNWRWPAEFMHETADHAVEFLNGLETRCFMHWWIEDNSLFLMAVLLTARDALSVTSAMACIVDKLSGSKSVALETASSIELTKP
jgi:hypothetical protein